MSGDTAPKSHRDKLSFSFIAAVARDVHSICHRELSMFQSAMSGDTTLKSHSAQKKVMSLFEFNWFLFLQERFEFFCRECNVLGETCGSLIHSCIHLFPPSFHEHSQQNSYSATPAFKKIDLLQKSIGGHVLDLGIDCFLWRTKNRILNQHTAS